MTLCQVGYRLRRRGSLTMKAWQYLEDGAPIALNDVPEPGRGAGDVLLEVRGAVICHSDIGFLDGTISSLLARKPITLGHESAGVVIELGPEVTGFAVGDRVAIRSAVEGPGCGRDGGFQHRLAAQAGLLVRIPDGVPWAQAAVSTAAGTTASHPVIAPRPPQPTTKISIFPIAVLPPLS